MKTSKRFSEKSIGKIEKNLFWFECAMISACKPAFDDCDDNYEVERKLRKAGVIACNNRTDTESSALVVRFSRKESADGFIRRLNNYLET